MKRLASAALLLALASVIGDTRAEAVRPGAAATLHAAHAPGDSPLHRGDNQRSGRAQGFPAELKPLWKIQLQGGADFAAVLARGELVVASANDLISIDAIRGREVSRAALPAAPAQAPVVTTRGDRVALTVAGECVFVSTDGAVRHRRPLPLRPRDAQVAPILTRDGGLVVAAGTTLLRLDAEARVVDSARLAEAPIGSLLEAPQGAVAVAPSGKVFRWHPPEAPALVGSLGGPTTGVAAVAGRHLIATSEGRRLVFFDLAAGVPVTSVSSGALLEGAPAIGGGNEAWISSSGVLFSVNSEGKELERVASQGTLGSPLVAGAQLAYLRLSGELALWSREQGERSSEQRVCGEPIALLSDGARLFVTCRDGTIAAYGAP